MFFHILLRKIRSHAALTFPVSPQDLLSCSDASASLRSLSSMASADEDASAAEVEISRLSSDHSERLITCVGSVCEREMGYMLYSFFLRLL